ncbi:MAG: aldo/keto reductase [Kiritimatiellae bacterium]|nr:aldo/keto reductase [Kiritimatiellia bacterium]
MKTIKLNNGVEMPQHGFGTFLIPKDKFSKTIGKAYELGIRQFDTAWRYRNEGDLAQALKDNGIDRRDVFITSKFNADAVCRLGWKWWAFGPLSFLNQLRKASIRDAIRQSLDRLKTDWIDLYLMHWPYDFYEEIWTEMARAMDDGLVRAIGVCSFLPPHFDALKSISGVLPAVNQFEISPLNTQKQLINYCQSRGIVVEAMGTFSHCRSNEPRMEILRHPILAQLARKHGKSVAQIVLKWLLQQDVAIIPKTWDERHLCENVELYDFELSPEDMATIDALDRGKFLNYKPLSARVGYFKRLWQWRRAGMPY